MAKIDTELAQLAESLRSVVGCDDLRDWAPVREFWAREPQRTSKPRAILSPVDYDGGACLSIACTQTALSAKEQKRLVDAWCEALPGFTGLQWIWFDSRVPQALFEAACRLPSLTGLNIKWSGIEDLEPMLACAKLRYFKLGSSASVRSIGPLGRMANLKWLQVDNVKAATSLVPLASMVQLEGLGFTGAEFKNFTIDSFDPLASMVRLRWLHLGAVHTRDQSLRGLAGLKELEWLGVGNFFPYEEFAWLSLQLSSSVCDWLQPYMRSHSSMFPCRKCKQNWKVMTSGKGGRLLCPTCDSIALARHVSKFNAARASAAAGEIIR